MLFANITEENRQEINALILNTWYSTEMIVRGKIIDMTKLEGIVAYDNEAIVGLVTYYIENKYLEVVSIDSFNENQGVGTELTKRVIEVAKSKGCQKVKLITTNDNFKALAFYQKRGFELVCIYKNAVEKARDIKPEIPIIGLGGIPIRDEIELEYVIK